MQLPPNAPQVIEFNCNICGHKNRLETSQFHRELAACKRCGALTRFRGIIHVLADLFGESDNLPLQKWPIRKHIYGLGMSDWLGYARLLRQKFTYENTFYDRKPYLDILNIRENRFDKYDFVICSDVFEHILQPIQQGFDNLFQLIKPGGHVIFSVPYTRTECTVEHYPGLRDYEILSFRRNKIIVYRDEMGNLHAHDNPVFHGAKGMTLEMRVFCETDVLARLAQAGFENIKIYDHPQFPIGFYWPPLPSTDPTAPLLYAYIMSARRPMTHSI